MISLRDTMGVLLLSFSVSAQAGQTGSFETFRHRAWACKSEASIARVMVQTTPSDMQRVAQRANCVRVQPGTPVWVHGGNALIEFGSVQGVEGLQYYPAKALE